MGKSGALFDLNKLNAIAANELSRLSAEEMLTFLKSWANEYGTDGQRAYFKDEEYMLRVLNLCMGTGGKKRRKDFVTARQAMEFIRYFFEEESRRDEYRVDAQTKNAILKSFGEKYSYSDDAQTWFSKVKEVAASLGFAAETKDYKANPEAYKGSVADVAEVLRIALTGRANTPDLWTVMQILGEEVSRKRLQKAAEEQA